MREDPIIAGGLIKVLLVLMVMGGVGYGGYRLVDGLGIDLDEVGATGDAIDSPQGSELETTEDSASPAADPRTAAGLAEAIDRFRQAAGGSARLTRITVSETAAQFFVLAGEGSTAYTVPAGGGEVQELPATITITGDAETRDFAFGLSAVDPRSIPRIVSRAARLVDAKALEVTTLGLERALPFGRRALEWTLNARKGTRALTFRASADGRRVQNVGGKGVEVPQAALDAEKLNRCVSDAGADTDAIVACLDQLGS